MRDPLPPGSPIDESRVQEWLERYSGYRHGVSAGTIERWLEQFGDDSDVAARVLDAVDYYTAAQIDAAYRSLLGRIPGWDVNDEARSGKWRFAPFTASSGESGDQMSHRFRTANGLGRNAYAPLFKYLRDLFQEELGPEDTVVLIDDFSGTGTQATAVWDNGLAELLPGRPTCYLVLVAATERAVSQIQENTDLQVVCHVLLGDSDDLFHDACTRFSSVEKERLLGHCRTASPPKPRGYGDCGLLVVMEHGCPNNSLPILHSRTDSFRGLFPRDH